jgi:hypothetical protein
LDTDGNYCVCGGGVGYCPRVLVVFEFPSSTVVYIYHLFLYKYSLIFEASDSAVGIELDDLMLLEILESTIDAGYHSSELAILITVMSACSKSCYYE